MAVRKVAVMGHPVLRKVAEAVSPKDIRSPAIQTLIEDMVETMHEYDGRGLAAPQVHESIQALVMLWDFDPKEKPTLLFLFNPVLKALTEATSSYWEGCLSVPGLRGKVARPNRVDVSALDHKGNAIHFVAEGFAATVVQHEVDHLLGRLYVDKLEDPTQFAFSREYSRYLAAPDDPADEG